MVVADWRERERGKGHSVGEGKVRKRRGVIAAADTSEEIKHGRLWFRVGCIWTLGPI
jgi:hypothetical protein